jgi:hypothetical protein
VNTAVFALTTRDVPKFLFEEQVGSTVVGQSPVGSALWWGELAEH